ncbi:polyhydroxybutyrate depolymerase [Frankia sp. Hr75.2]|nr:polyhydroxybutyrate depolymerase [Frankia sp. Hr75.2]
MTLVVAALATGLTACAPGGLGFGGPGPAPASPTRASSAAPSATPPPAAPTSTGPTGVPSASPGPPDTGTAPAPSDIPVGRSTQTVLSGGTSRTVHVYRPAGVTEPAPLVVMLHGGYGGGVQAEQAYHWDAAADAGRFLAVFPDGSDRSWNAGGGCCGPAARSGVDDVAFLTETVASLGRQITLDPDRIYVSGVSNGGAMAYRMACETDLFAAVGVDSTTMLVDCADAAPTSVLHIHGTDDPIIRFDGAPGQPYSPNSPPIDGPPVPEVNATWRAVDGCAEPHTSTVGVVTTSTASCPASRRAVELVTIAGAGHQWPGATPKPAAQVLGASSPSTALDATDTIWRFFAEHPRPDDDPSSD